MPQGSDVYQKDWLLNKQLLNEKELVKGEVIRDLLDRVGMLEKEVQKLSAKEALHVCNCKRQ